MVIKGVYVDIGGILIVVGVINVNFRVFVVML